MKITLKTIALVAGLIGPPLSAYIEMRMAIGHLQDEVAEIRHDVSRINRSIYGEASNGTPKLEQQ